MDKQDFIGLCPTCEKVCKQVNEQDGWWKCSNCTWIWEPQDKQDLTDRIKGESVNHPSHYGGDSKYEAIKVIEAWGLGFNLGNVVKYISRAGKKGKRQEDLEKALWYLERELGRGTN